MLSIKDIYWVAGFIEGEGCFTIKKGTPRICVAQKQLEPLERLEAMFGGVIGIANKNGVYYWNAQPPSLAIELMMTLYPIMSPRRQSKIKEIIVSWKSYNHSRGYWKQGCKNGHPLSQFYINPNNMKGRCRKCLNEWTRKYRLADRVATNNQSSKHPSAGLSISSGH